jgi:hypothetical protein
MMIIFQDAIDEERAIGNSLLPKGALLHRPHRRHRNDPHRTLSPT